MPHSRSLTFVFSSKHFIYYREKSTTVFLKSDSDHLMIFFHHSKSSFPKSHRCFCFLARSLPDKSVFPGWGPAQEDSDLGLLVATRLGSKAKVLAQGPTLDETYGAPWETNLNFPNTPFSLVWVLLRPLCV